MNFKKIKDFRRAFPCEDLNSGIRVLWFNPNFTKKLIKTHRHNFFEAHYILNGGVVYKIGDRDFKVSAGEVLFIPPKIFHEISTQSDDIIKLGMAFTVLDTNRFEFDEKPFVRKIKESEKSIFDLIFIEVNSKAEFYILKNATFSLCTLLAKSVPLNETTHYDERFLRARTFILDNTNRNLSPDEVADFVFLSPKQLGRIFKKYENMSVTKFIEKVRCNMAKQLFDSEKLSVREVSDRLGFSNEYNFCRFFKRVEGIVPSRYLKIK